MGVLPRVDCPIHGCLAIAVERLCYRQAAAEDCAAREQEHDLDHYFSVFPSSSQNRMAYFMVRSCDELRQRLFALKGSGALVRFSSLHC